MLVLAFASLIAEAVVVIETGIACDAGDPRPAVALARVRVAGLRPRADLAAAAEATASAHDAEAVLALPACPTSVLLLAVALASLRVAPRAHRAELVAVAG